VKVWWLPACLPTLRVKGLRKRSLDQSWTDVNPFLGEDDAWAVALGNQSKLLGKRRIIWSRHNPTSSSSASDLLMRCCCCCWPDLVKCTRCIFKTCVNPFPQRTKFQFCNVAEVNYDRHNKRSFSQIWLHTRYQSRKNPESFYIFGYNSQNPSVYFWLPIRTLFVFLALWQSAQFPCLLAW
jgi:hypothetical protein